MKSEEVEAAIYIIGQNILQNQLLARFLQEQSGVACDCDPHLEPKGIASVASKRTCLLLLDGKQKSLSDVCDNAEIGKVLGIPGTLVALFNVDPCGDSESNVIMKGIKGVFYHQDPPHHIAKGAKAILDGELWYTRKAMSKCLGKVIAKGDFPEEKKPVVPLTPKEREILICIANGMNNKEISEKLCISPHTAKTHTYRIFKKLGVHNRFQAALWATKYLDW